MFGSVPPAATGTTASATTITHKLSLTSKPPILGKPRSTPRRSRRASTRTGAPNQAGTSGFASTSFSGSRSLPGTGSSTGSMTVVSRSVPISTNLTLLRHDRRHAHHVQHPLRRRQHMLSHRPQRLHLRPQRLILRAQEQQLLIISVLLTDLVAQRLNLSQRVPLLQESHLLGSSISQVRIPSGPTPIID